MQALTWIAPGHEAAALMRQPATCPATASDPAEAEAGRGLFHAPQLLGGQAARAGLSCASCHVNGRGNPHFFLSGISAAPGTADVSASFFGLGRANARFDPKPIPDLALPGRISRDPASGELEAFLRGLVVEEFSGREPGKATLAALASYVRTIRPCPDRADEPLALAVQLDLVRASVRGAVWFVRRGEPTSAAVLVAGARRQLGLIDERFASPRLAGERRALLGASRQLQPIAESTAPDPARLNAWLAEFDRNLAPSLLRAEPRSLYAPIMLDRHTAGQRVSATGSPPLTTAATFSSTVTSLSGSPSTATRSA
jgi:hypothetical protein